MQILPIDLVALVGTVLGIMIVLVPIMGLTARYALKPTVEVFSRFFAHQGTTETVRLLERRLDLQEQQIENLENTLRRLAEGSDFDRQLLASARVRDAAPEADAPRPGASTPPSPASPPTPGAARSPSSPDASSEPPPDEG